MDAIRTHVRAECEGGCGRTHVRLGLDLGSLAADWTDPGLALRREDSRVASGAVGVGQVHGRFPFCLAVISYPASPVPVYGNARGSSRTSSRRNRRIGLTAPVSPATQTNPSPGRPAGTAKCLLTVQSPGPSRCRLETGSWLERRAAPSGGVRRGRGGGPSPLGGFGGGGPEGGYCDVGLALSAPAALRPRRRLG